MEGGHGVYSPGRWEESSQEVIKILQEMLMSVDKTIL